MFPLFHPKCVERLVQTRYDALYQFLSSSVDFDVFLRDLSHFTYGLNLY
jgi:hypothetical protein